MFFPLFSSSSVCKFIPSYIFKKTKVFILYSKFQQSKFSSTTRGNYKTVSSKDVDFFISLLGSSRTIQDFDELEPYNTDWLRSHKGKSTLLLRPKTTEEVSAILKYCNNEKLAVCPQGGNTGLVGGSTPIFDEIIISTSLMNKVLQFDDNTGVLQCQAGCILESLESYVNERYYTVPLDLGAKGSCQIGGNLSTNAGGLRFIRYGSLHGNVLGLTAASILSRKFSFSWCCTNTNDENQDLTPGN